jgi:hypothetical protein
MNIKMIWMDWTVCPLYMSVRINILQSYKRNAPIVAMAVVRKPWQKCIEDINSKTGHADRNSAE